MEDVDPFEVRIKFLRAVQAITDKNGAVSTKALLSAYNYSQKYHEFCKDFVQCIIEELANDQPLGKDATKGLIQLLDCILYGGVSGAEAANQKPTLVMNKYQQIIAQNSSKLFEIIFANDSQPSAVVASIVARWIKDFLKDSLPNAEEVLEKLNNLSKGPSQDLESIPKARKKILDAIEKEREGHKALREATWSRPDSESFLAEFEEMWLCTDALSEIDYATIEQDQELFHRLNGRETDQLLNRKRKLPRLEERQYPMPMKPPTSSPGREEPRRHTVPSTIPIGSAPTNIPRPKLKQRPVYVFELDNICVFLQKLLTCTDNYISEAAQKLQYSIKRLAKEFFFYGDLRKEYGAPNVRYFIKDDDGRDLDKHPFDSDRLSLYQREGSGKSGHFVLERAYRLRAMAKLYDEMPSHLTTSAVLKEVEEAYDNLDTTTRNVHTRALKLIKRLLTQEGAIGYIISHTPLSLLLATCIAFRLQPLVPSDRIFDSTLERRKWCFQELKYTIHPSSMFEVIVLVYHKDSRDKQLAREVVLDYPYMNWRHETIKDLVDFERLVDYLLAKGSS